MNNNTAIKLASYIKDITSINNAASNAQKFNVLPSVQQTMERKVQELDTFLQKVNFVFPEAQQGQILKLGINSSIASNTDTDTKQREGFDHHDLESFEYNCTQTNFDTAIKYSVLDMWAHDKNFTNIIRENIARQKALDRIKIAFHGVKRAKTSDKSTYPKLEDVNIGWLQKWRSHAPERVLTGGADPSKIVISEQGDYKNLASLVHNCVNTLIDPVFNDDPSLVVICARKMLSDRYFAILNQSNINSETVAANILLENRTICGMQVIAPPFFPEDTILITSLKNLAIYIQLGSARRAIIDNPARDRIENYESCNEAYVVEEYRAGCLIENIEVN